MKSKKYVFYLKTQSRNTQTHLPLSELLLLGCVISQLPPYPVTAVFQTCFGPHACLWLAVLNIFHQLQARHLFLLRLQAELK